MTTIHHSKVLAALELLGVEDHKNVRHITIDARGEMTVSRLFMPDGKPLADGNRFVFTEETVRIDWSPSIVGISGQEEQ